MAKSCAYYEPFTYVKPLMMTFLGKVTLRFYTTVLCWQFLSYLINHYCWKVECIHSIFFIQIPSIYCTLQSHVQNPLSDVLCLQAENVLLYECHTTILTHVFTVIPIPTCYSTCLLKQRRKSTVHILAKFKTFV